MGTAPRGCNPSIWRLGQVDHQFEASLGYVVIPRYPELESEILSQNVKGRGRSWGGSKDMFSVRRVCVDYMITPILLELWSNACTAIVQGRIVLEWPPCQRPQEGTTLDSDSLHT